MAKRETTATETAVVNETAKAATETTELEDAANKIKELEEKLAEAEKVIESVTNAKATEKVTESVTNTEVLEEKRVKIKLFKDNKDYKDDLTVGVNGKIYQIRRGVEVEVPQAVYEVICNSQAQDERTAELIDSLVESTLNVEKENGI